MGYTSHVPELDGPDNIYNWGYPINVRNTKNVQTEELEKMAMGTFTPFLTNAMIEREGMVFIGNTLYTDFKLFGEENQAACMMEAAHKMNDFHRCTQLEKDREMKVWQVKPFTVETHAKLFRVCLGYINNRLQYLRNHNNTNPIIIVTHHCPLPFCISDKYKNDPLSAAFASDLRWFIKKYPEIRLWCSGHVHEPYDFLYNETRFVCEPWGYFNENNFKIENYGKRISIQDIKSKKGWRSLLKSRLGIGVTKDYGYCDDIEDKEL